MRRIPHGVVCVKTLALKLIANREGISGSVISYKINVIGFWIVIFKGIGSAPVEHHPLLL